MSYPALEKTLQEFGLTEVYFGPEGFRINTGEELPQAQLGYARHPDGADLTGAGEGDWKKGWVVFGHDPDLGDPYFVVDPAIVNHDGIHNQTSNRHGIVGYLNDATVARQIADSL